VPLVVAGLGVSLLLLMSAFGYLTLHQTAVSLVRAIFGGWADKKGFRKWFFKAIGLNALAKALDYCLARVRSAISHMAAVHLPHITAFFNGMKQLQHETYRELGAIAHDAATGYDWIVRHTLPGQIAKRTIPIKAQATAAGAAAAGALAGQKADRRITFKGIDKLRKEMGLLAGIVLGIDVLVKRGTGAKRHHFDHTHTIPNTAAGAAAAGALAESLAKEVAKTKSRLRQIEKALGLGVFAALVYRILARVAPWLFCRNVKKLGNLACGLRPDTMTALTTLLLGTLAISNLETLARFTVAIEEEVTSEVKDLLGA
jgi:hypothetical protein